MQNELTTYKTIAIVGCSLAAIGICAVVYQRGLINGLKNKQLKPETTHAANGEATGTQQKVVEAIKQDIYEMPKMKDANGNSIIIEEETPIPVDNTPIEMDLDKKDKRAKKQPIRKFNPFAIVVAAEDTWLYGAPHELEGLRTGDMIPKGTIMGLVSTTYIDASIKDKSIEMFPIYKTDSINGEPISMPEDPEAFQSIEVPLAEIPLIQKLPEFYTPKSNLEMIGEIVTKNIKN